MTVDEFIKWLRENTKPEDQIEYIDFHGADVESLRFVAEQSDGGPRYIHIIESY